MSDSASQKKTRRKKDPNAPKAPLSAYMYFCKEYRPRMRSEHPEWEFTDVGRELGKLWKDLDPVEKTVS
jgi:hypothetical protein